MVAEQRKQDSKDLFEDRKVTSATGLKKSPPIWERGNTRFAFLPYATYAGIRLSANMKGLPSGS